MVCFIGHILLAHVFNQLRKTGETRKKFELIYIIKQKVTNDVVMYTEKSCKCQSVREHYAPLRRIITNNP